jgi:hypothetical protein
MSGDDQHVLAGASNTGSLADTVIGILGVECALWLSGAYSDFRALCRLRVTLCFSKFLMGTRTIPDGCFAEVAVITCLLGPSCCLVMTNLIQIALEGDDNKRESMTGIPLSQATVFPSLWRKG